MDDQTLSYLISSQLLMLVLQMPLTVCLRGEAKVANLTFKGLLARVPPHVPGEGALVVAGVGAGAHVTPVGGLAQVLLVVALQCP